MLCVMRFDVVVLAIIILTSPVDRVARPCHLTSLSMRHRASVIDHQPRSQLRCCRSASTADTVVAVQRNPAVIIEQVTVLEQGVVCMSHITVVA